MPQKTNKFDIDMASIRKLAKLIEETGLTEIEYAEGDRKIRCVGAQTNTVVAAAPMTAAPIASTSPAAGSVPDKEEFSGFPVTSPMVGTVYLAPSPGAEPFVKKGDKIKEGDTLLIIEAMKVMNPIKAPKAGTVGLILVDDAKPVEFGDTLLVLE